MIAVCVNIAGAQGGAVLYRAVYWTPRATIVLQGKSGWIAKDAATWVHETALSASQYRRAITKLRRAGLIETKQAWFGGRKITHLRLTERTLDLLPHDPQLGSRSGEVAVEPKCAPERGNSAQPTDERDRASRLHNYAQPLLNTGKRKNYKQEKESPPADASGQPVSSVNKSLSGEMDKEKIATSPQNNFEKGPAPSSPPSSAKYSDAEAYWRSTVEELHGQHVSKFTQQTAGQLKSFLVRCPDGTAPAILTCVLENWAEFTRCAKDDAGAFNIPKVPQIGFLLRYFDAAHAFWISATKPQPKLHMPAKLSAAASSPAVELTVDERAQFEEWVRDDLPPSAEEMQDILGFHFLTPEDEAKTAARAEEKREAVRRKMLPDFIHKIIIPQRASGKH